MKYLCSVKTAFKIIYTATVNGVIKIGADTNILFLNDHSSPVLSPLYVVLIYCFPFNILNDVLIYEKYLAL